MPPKYYGQGFEWVGNLINDFNGTTHQMQYNAEQAEINRQFQERLSNTAYQRAVNDMKMAGINPASLSGDGGMSPSSVPSGSAASSNIGNPGSSIGRIFSTALSLALFKGVNKVMSKAFASGNTARGVAQSKVAFNNVKQGILEESVEHRNKYLSDYFDKHGHYPPDF